jgi:flagellar assembly protein FliH
MTLRKFAFDTEFDATGEVAYAAPRPKRAFTAEEVEEVRARAYSEGERAALTSITAQQTAAVSEISRGCAQAMTVLAAVAHEHRAGAAELALACARAIAGAALDLFPQAPAQAALEALAREIEAAPRLILGVAPDEAETLQAVMEGAAQKAGFPGAIQIRPDVGLGRHAFTLDFGDGSAAFDPVEAAQRVAETLRSALAAEGLHAESLTPPGA